MSQQQNPQGQPQPRDVFESRFDKSLNELDKAMRRAYNLKGQVEAYFVEIQELQWGNNTIESLQRVKMAMIRGDYNDPALYDPASGKINKEKADKLPQIDISGWDKNFSKIVKRFQKIDEAVSYVPDAITNFIEIMARTDNMTRIPTVNMPKPGTDQPVTLQAEEGNRFLGMFRGLLDTLKPQYKQNAERALNILAPIIEDYYKARTVWEEYKQYYMQLRSEAFLNNPKALYPNLFLQDELLMRDMGIIVQAFAKGNRAEILEIRRAQSKTADEVVRAKGAMAQQNAAITAAAAANAAVNYQMAGSNGNGN